MPVHLIGPDAAGELAPVNARSRARELVRGAQPTNRTLSAANEPLDGLVRNLLGNRSRLPSCSWSRRTRGRQRCYRASCIPCRLERGLAVAEDVFSALTYAQRHNFTAHSLTLQATSSSLPHMADIARSWSRLNDNLARSAPSLYWTAHRSAWGLCPRTGRLHRHVVTLGGPRFDVKVRRSLVPILQERASAVGLHVWIEPVTQSRASHVRLSNYFAANGLGFALAHAPYSKGLVAFPRPSSHWPVRSRSRR